MFRIKQYIKMLLQNLVLPVLYLFFSRRPVEKGLILFADAHHNEVPFSMRRMYELAKKKEAEGECRIEEYIGDFGKMSFGAMVSFLMRFMKAYAAAEQVYICDYFLPVAACKKRKETTVVQLWHSCGLMKRIAYDAKEDIPKNYRGNMFGNYSCLTLSAPVCVPVHARALRLSRRHIFATGVSRTDYYFDEKWNEDCRRRFFEQYPEAKGRKIVLWASTFRGNAANARAEGLEEVKEAAEMLEDWFFLMKAHPHVDAHAQVSNCSLPTEELLPVADVLVTDYSSVMFDYLLYRRPVVLFAPDLEDYVKNRGFYLDYTSIPYPVTKTAQELAQAVRDGEEWQTQNERAIEAFTEKYVGSCDGRATERIWNLVTEKGRS